MKIDLNELKKIIIISLSGMGNTILFSPVIRTIKEKFPQISIDLLVSQESYALPLQKSNLLNQIYFPRRHHWAQYLITFYQLSHNHYDLSVCAFPSDRWHYNLASWLSGARIRLTHRYKEGFWHSLKQLSFMQNIKIPVNEELHDVEQNGRLLNPFNLEFQDKNLLFALDQDDLKWAKSYLREKKLQGKTLVGFHPGSNPHQAWKRWPAEKFINLAKMFQKYFQAEVLIFIGPDEKEDLIKYQRLKEKSYHLIKDLDLFKVAALIKNCNLFISNDSGLMHIAVALKVPTVCVNGPTNFGRTGPWGDDHLVIRHDIDCSPCFNFPFRQAHAKIKCRYLNCLNTLSSEKVLQLIKNYYGLRRQLVRSILDK